MILPRDRKLAAFLIRIGIWHLTDHNLFGRPDISPSKGTWWLYKRMLKRQTRDGLHHAPGCAGNEWSGAKLVWQGCTCGAAGSVRRLLALAADNCSWCAEPITPADPTVMLEGVRIHVRCEPLARAEADLLKSPPSRTGEQNR